MVLTFDKTASIGEVSAKYDVVHINDGDVFLLELNDDNVRFVRKWETGTLDVAWDTPDFPPRVQFTNSRVNRDYRYISSLGMFGIMY